MLENNAGNAFVAIGALPVAPNGSYKQLPGPRRKGGSLVCSATPPKQVEVQRRPASCQAPVARTSSFPSLPLSSSQPSNSIPPNSARLRRASREATRSRSSSPVRNGPSRRPHSPSVPVVPIHHQSRHLQAYSGTRSLTSTHSSSSPSLICTGISNPKASSSGNALTKAATPISSIPWLKQDGNDNSSPVSMNSARSGSTITGKPARDNKHPQCANAEAVLATWLSEKTSLIVQGALSSVESVCTGIPSNWNGEEVRRFGIHLLSAHGIEPPQWPLSTWLDIHSTVIWLSYIGERERSPNSQHAEKLARRIFEHLVGAGIGESNYRYKDSRSPQNNVNLNTSPLPEFVASSTSTMTTNIASDTQIPAGPYRHRTIARTAEENGLPRNPGKVAWRGKLGDPMVVEGSALKPFGTQRCSFDMEAVSPRARAPNGETSLLNGIPATVLRSSPSNAKTEPSVQMSAMGHAESLGPLGSSPSASFLSAVKVDAFNYPRTGSQCSLDSSSQTTTTLTAKVIRTSASSDDLRTGQELREKVVTLQNDLDRERADNKAAWHSLANVVEDLFQKLGSSTEVSANADKQTSQWKAASSSSESNNERIAFFMDRVISSLAEDKGSHVVNDGLMRHNTFYEDANDELSLVSLSEEPSAVLKAVDSVGMPSVSPMRVGRKDEPLSSPVKYCDIVYKGVSSGISPIRISPGIESSPALSMSQDIASWTSAVLGATPMSVASLGDESECSHAHNCSALEAADSHDKKLAVARAILGDLAVRSPQPQATSDAYKLSFYREKCSELYKKELQLQEEIRHRDDEVRRLQVALNEARGILLGAPEAGATCSERNKH